MFKKIALALVVAAFALAAVVATRPSDFRIERSTTINAPADIAYGLVSDFHGWADWSPWEALDPAMKKTFTGQAGEKGSSYEWLGNKDVGEGRMTIVEAKPSSLVEIKLEFIKPFAATSQTTLTFEPAGDKTKVTWAMVGQNNFVAKAMTLFMNMDKMVGADFEKGLAKLGEKSAAEHAVRVAAAQKKAAEEAAQRAAAEAAMRKAAEEAAQAAAAPAAAPQKKS